MITYLSEQKDEDSRKTQEWEKQKNEEKQKEEDRQKTKEWEKAKKKKKK